MRDEYNELYIINSEQPKNVAGYALKNDAAVSEARDVTEPSYAQIEEAGSTRTAGLSKSRSAQSKSISSAISRVTVTASAATVVAAVVVVAAVTGAEAAAPLASVSGANVSYYDGADVRIEFVLTDEDGELEDLYAWIEDGGEEIACVISSIEGVYSAETTLVSETGTELYFVVYGAAGDWSGELYREILILPSAPEVSVGYEAAYNSESGELVITYAIDESALGGYDVKITDASGAEIEYTPDYAANTVTAIISDTSAELYFVVNVQASNGWHGEIYRDKITVPDDTQGGETDTPDDPEPSTPDEPEPTAPEVGVDYSVTYNADSYELVISYALTDVGGGLSDYAVKLTDESGNEISSTADYTANTITATVTDAAGTIYFVISGTTSDGWTGEIGSYAITISDAPDIGLEYTVAYNAETYELVITYSLDSSSLIGYAVKLTDVSGNEISSTADYTANTITAIVTDAAGTIYLVISGTTSDGWTGGIYNGAVTVPSAPDVGVEYTVTYSANSGGLVISFSLDESLLSEYTVKLTDASGGEVTSDVDYGAKTITITVSESADAYNLIIEAVSVGGWTGELYRAEINLSALTPTVEVTGAAVALYNTETNYLAVQFTIDDPDGELAYHEASFTDVNGGEVTCALSIDGSVYTVSADISALNTSGGLTLVVYVISNTGWDGTLYSGALTLPTAPTQAAAEVYYSFNGDSNELTITYEIYDHGGELSGGYTVQLTDVNGNVIESMVDETEGTLTAVIADTTVDYVFTAYGTTSEGWYGGIYSEEIYIPSAPELSVDIGAESLYEEGAGGEIYVYVSYLSDTSDIYAYEYWIEDMNGLTYAGVWDDAGSCFVVTLAAEDVLEYSADGQLYVAIYVTTYGGWQGTAYRELQYL